MTTLQEIKNPRWALAYRVEGESTWLHEAYSSMPTPIPTPGAQVTVPDKKGGTTRRLVLRVLVDHNATNTGADFDYLFQIRVIVSKNEV